MKKILAVKHISFSFSKKDLLNPRNQSKLLHSNMAHHLIYPGTRFHTCGEMQSTSAQILMIEIIDLLHSFSVNSI